MWDRRQEIDIQDSTPNENDVHIGCTQSQAWVNLQAVQSRAEFFQKGKQSFEQDNYMESRHARTRRENRELASLELPDHSPEFGRRMSWLCAFETMDTIRLRRALLAFVRARTHIKGICERRTGLCFGGRSTKTEPTRGRHLLPIGDMVEPSVLAEGRTTCSCLIAVA